MGLVTSTEMFKKAYEGHYAIGAFNVNNMEIIQGITEAASEENAPLILAGIQGRTRNTPTTPISMKLVEAACDRGEPGICPSRCTWTTATAFETVQEPASTAVSPPL